jgi:hypothetical protein
VDVVRMVVPADSRQVRISYNDQGRVLEWGNNDDCGWLAGRYLLNRR